MTKKQSSSDEHYMRLALELSRKGQGMVEPNPMVGCVLVKDDQVIGQGYHQHFGGPHAEIVALDSVEAGLDAQGATAYVTLEPCCHQGKTPPCSRALIEAGVRRVVVAAADPNPSVNGGGIRELTSAGIEVTQGILELEAKDILAPFLKLICQKQPWVIAKWAMTVDGRIATVSGESQWITGESARAAVHDLRRRVDAIAVGMGTVNADDPLLTARPCGDRGMTRVVFCRNRIPSLQSRLVQTVDETPVLCFVSPLVDANQLKNLEHSGCEVVRLQTKDSVEMVDAALNELGQRNVTNLMLEGGGQLIGSFLAANQIDECHVYIGGKLFGGDSAPGPIGGKGIAAIDQAECLQLQSMERFGNDVCLCYRRKK